VDVDEQLVAADDLGAPGVAVEALDHLEAVVGEFQAVPQDVLVTSQAPFENMMNSFLKQCSPVVDERQELAQRSPRELPL
jgi:hypothetical protein